MLAKLKTDIILFVVAAILLAVGFISGSDKLIAVAIFVSWILVFLLGYRTTK